MAILEVKQVWDRLPGYQVLLIDLASEGDTYDKTT